MKEIRNSGKKVDMYQGYADAAIVCVDALTKAMESIAEGEKRAKYSACSRVYNRFAEITSYEKGSGSIFEVVANGCQVAIDGCDKILQSHFDESIHSRARKAKEAAEMAMQRAKREFAHVAIPEDGEEDWSDANRGLVTSGYMDSIKHRQNFILAIGELVQKFKDEDTSEAFSKWCSTAEDTCNATLVALNAIRLDLRTLNIDANEMYEGLKGAVAAYKQNTAAYTGGNKSAIDPDMTY